MCFLRKAVPGIKIVAIDKNDTRLEIARATKKADVVQKMYVALCMQEFWTEQP